MSIRQWTPFRQLLNGYTALHDSRRLLAGLAAAQLSSDLRVDRLDAAISELSASLARRIAAPATGADEQVAATVVPNAASAVSATPGGTARVGIHELLGFRLLLDRDSLLDRILLESGEWEHEQLDYFTGLVERMRGRPGAIFVDVGAYWGLYTLVAHGSGAFDALYAIEADRHNFAQLQANLFLNGAAKSVSCINKAASFDDGPLLFRDSASHADGNRAGTSVLPHDTTLPGVQVPATSVDALLAGAGEEARDVLMKIDVEGFEAYVLRGMTETVRRHRIVVQVEIFDEHREPAFAEIERLGLVQIHRLYPDYWFTNHPDFLPAA